MNIKMLAKKNVLVLIFLIFTGGLFISVSAYASSYPSPYYVFFGVPDGLYMNIDSRDSYILGRNNEIHTVLSGAPQGASPTWGRGLLLNTVRDFDSLPEVINLRWFSAIEDKFWDVRVPLDTEKIRALLNVNAKYWDKDYSNTMAFTINILPSGKGVIWMNYGGQTRILSQFQATEIDLEWNGFFSTVYTFQEDRKTFVQEVVAEATPDIKALIEANPAQISAEPWTRLLAKYNWGLVVSPSFKLEKYYLISINEEGYWINPSEEPKTQMQGLPRILLVKVVDRAGKMHTIRVDVDKEQIMRVFKELRPDLNLEPLYIGLYIDDAMVNAGLFVGKDSTQHISINATINKVDNDY